MPTPDEIAAFLAALPRPEEKDASAVKAMEMLAQNKARPPQPMQPTGFTRGSGAPFYSPQPAGYVEESIESLKKGARDVYEGAVETFGPEGFGERYREAPIPQAAESGAMGRVITGPALRAGYSLATSPAATMLGETGASTGFTPVVPPQPRAGALAGVGRPMPEAGGAAERTAAGGDGRVAGPEYVRGMAGVPESERIIGATITYDGKTWDASTHGEAFDKADMETGGIQGGVTEGFRSSSGRNVSREEAAKIAGHDPTDKNLRFETSNIGGDAGAAASPYRPPSLAATEDLGARGLIQQQYGLAQRTTAHLEDLIENTPLKEPQAASTGSQVAGGEPWYGVITKLNQQPVGQEVGMLKPQGVAAQTNQPFRPLSFAQAEARVTPDERKLFQKYIETRSVNPDLRWQLSPHLQAAADVHRSIMSDMLHMLQNVDVKERIGFVRDYLPHIYHETPEWAAWMSTRGRRGDIPTYEEARASGFTPRFNMVADIDHAYIRAMNRYLAGREVENALKEQGVLKYPGSNTPIPKDWELLKHGRFKEHPAYAPKAIARDYNRWYAQGFANDYTNAAMSLLQGMRSMTFAGDFRWHGINELHEATGMQLARTFDNMREGNISRAIKAVAQAPGGPLSAYLRGRKGMRIYLRQSAMDAGQQALNNDLKAIKAGVPDDEYLINILTEAHAVPHWREFIDLQLNEESVGRYMHRRGMTLGNFLKSAGSNIGNIPGRISKEMKSNKPLLAKAIIAPAEVVKGVTGVMNIISEPLFGHAIPRVKLGSNLQRLSDWYAANPFASREDAIAAARKIGKAGDNVYGEMNRDTMWISRGIQHALDLTMLAPGWNIGSAILAGKGAMGTARRALRTMTLGHIDPNAPSFSMSNAHWDPNISSAFGGIVGSLLIGGALTWFMTGKPPSGLLDYINPRTGTSKTDEKGRKVEVRLKANGNIGWDESLIGNAGLPAMGTQGFYPELISPGTEIRNKVHPLLGTAYDLFWKNRNFKDQPIYSGAPGESIGPAARYAAGQLTPFTFQEKAGGLPGLWGDPHLPTLLRLGGAAEAGMQFERPKEYIGMMRRKAGPIAEKRGKKPNRWAPVQ